MMRMSERIAIITGGSKGIGKSVIDLFKSKGIICYDFSRSTNNIDIADEESVDMNVKSIIRKHGKIDILVNNAGIVSTTDILDMSLIEWKNIIDVNLTGMFIVTKSVLKYMVDKKYGKIIINGVLRFKSYDITNCGSELI
jgi:3-oxoacyl-[acyl-carrier protein] reductase